jgi:hypothetical protein
MVILYGEYNIKIESGESNSAVSDVDPFQGLVYRCFGTERRYRVNRGRRYLQSQTQYADQGK